MKKSECLTKVTNDDEVLVHIVNLGPTDHATLCGLDGNDETLGQRVLPLGPDDKMNCLSCRSFYENRKKLNLHKTWISSTFE